MNVQIVAALIGAVLSVSKPFNGAIVERDAALSSERRAVVTGTVGGPGGTLELEPVSTIRFEPFSGQAVVRWVQPDDGSGALYVRSSAGEQDAKQVQRDRMTDDLFLCSALLGDSGTGKAEIGRRADGADETGGTDPLGLIDLAGMRLVLDGQDGRTYVAQLGSRRPRILQSGPIVRSERHTVRFHAPGAPPILGVHVYATRFAGSDRIEIALRIHDGAARADRMGFCGRVYYRGLRLEAPGLVVCEGDPEIARGENVFLPRAQLVRRFVLERPSALSGTRPRPRIGYAAEGASFFDLPAYGPEETLVPRVQLDGLTHSGSDFTGLVLGPFRLIDEPSPEAPGGKWIFPFLGARRGIDPREGSLSDLRTIADRVQERMPIACFDETTGEPIWTWQWAAANGGRQPFQYDVAARRGIQRWDLPGSPFLPSGVLTGTMGMGEDQGLEVNQGVCAYEAELRRWVPYDGQHLVRGYTHAAALWYWTGDALAADSIRMIAADAGYDYTMEDVGGVETPYKLRSLKKGLERAHANPGQGGDCDREWVWTSVAASIAARIDDDPRLADWCASLLEYAATLAMPSGIPWRIYAPGDGGNVVYWSAYGTPLDKDACGTFQVPMIAHALWCLAESADRPHARREARGLVVRMAEAILDPTQFTPSVYDPLQRGPAMSTWVADHGGMPLRTVRSSGNSNPTNYPLLYALAHRATGDARWLDELVHFGTPGPKSALQLALGNTGFCEPLAPLLAAHQQVQD